MVAVVAVDVAAELFLSFKSMTPEGISPEDWKPLQEAAMKFVNASLSGDTALDNNSTEELFFLLDGLEEKYGRVSALISTRADFSPDPGKAINLYEEVLDGESDETTRILALQSLVSLLIEEKSGDQSIESRLAELKEISKEDSPEWEEYLDLVEEYHLS